MWELSFASIIHLYNNSKLTEVNHVNWHPSPLITPEWNMNKMNQDG